MLFLCIAGFRRDIRVAVLSFQFIPSINIIHSETMKKPAIAGGPNLKFSSYAVALTETKIKIFSEKSNLHDTKFYPWVHFVDELLRHDLNAFVVVGDGVGLLETVQLHL